MNPAEPQQPPSTTTTTCPLHPNEPHFTGFCPSCLFERLSVLDQSASSSTTATAGRKSASSTIKSLFKNNDNRPSFRSKPGSFLPELRRTKSFSGARNNVPFSGVLEPQRRSCDVRARATLHSLFNQPEEENSNSAEQEIVAVAVAEVEEDTMDVDSEKKKASSGASFWSKLRSWTRKGNKMKKSSNGRKVEQSKKSRETQSEVADYGYGRRSCDTDPRVSIDVGRMSLDYGYGRRLSCDTDPRVSIDVARMSVDDPRYSFDEPRASWDNGGGRKMPSMVPVVESINPAEQTKDYYEDCSSSRRRKSLDRSSSMRKTAASVVAEMDEIPVAVESVPNLGRDDCSESFDFGYRDRKGAKKSRSWRSWNIWGLIVGRGGSKDEEDDRYSRGNGVERAFSESWQELGRDGYGGDPRVGFRSNSSVSWRNSYKMGGPNGHAKKKSNEFVLERNRSARYSKNDVDNGMLRFYLTPMRGSRRGPMAKAKPAAYSHTIARSALRTY